MYRIKRLFSTAFLAGALFSAVVVSGCAGHVRVYDEYHSDYHPWNHHEDVAYHQYWSGRHEPYRDYNNLNKNEQRDYWNWRHDHPNGD